MTAPRARLAADLAEEALLVGGLGVVAVGALLRRAGVARAGMAVGVVGAAVILAGREVGDRGARADVVTRERSRR